MRIRAPDLQLPVGCSTTELKFCLFVLPSDRLKKITTWSYAFDSSSYWFVLSLPRLAIVRALEHFLSSQNFRFEIPETGQAFFPSKLRVSFWVSNLNAKANNSQNGCCRNTIKNVSFFSASMLGIKI